MACFPGEDVTAFVNAPQHLRLFLSSSGCLNPKKQISNASHHAMIGRATATKHEFSSQMFAMTKYEEKLCLYTKNMQILAKNINYTQKIMKCISKSVYCVKEKHIQGICAAENWNDSWIHRFVYKDVKGFQLDRRKRRCHGGIQTDNFLKKEKAIDASEAAHTKCSSKSKQIFTFLHHLLLFALSFTLNCTYFTYSSFTVLSE
ncbi:hypothetical protein EGR_10632 [Echinococcus granulosus]|uniref:Uncharacterized protein n=1 Tax=Echinococcus granulosus TaxID=6210 RepID=W6ULZ9_ECHGR|nr:hypothetical protein EGR_10632 [Echinococcus granulosus]EUB54509.1 hypothetical protein EGR_10632 [Echinococcus granulosus]